MKLWNVITSLVVGTTLLTTSCTTEQQKLLRQQEINHLIDSLPRDQLLQVLELNPALFNQYKHQIDQKPNTDTLTIDMNRVKKWPLWNSKLFPSKTKFFPKTLWRLLWDNYPSELLYTYNPELREVLNNTKILNQVSYNQIHTDHIKIPAIYPDLVDFLVPSLQDFITQHPDLKDSLWSDTEVIIATRNKDGANVLAYYHDGYIRIAQYGAFGSWEIKKEYNPKTGKTEWVDTYTPECVYYTNYNADLKRPIKQKDWTVIYRFDKGDKSDSTKVSNKYDAAMQYWKPLANSTKQTGIYIHTRRVIIGEHNKNERSHQCVWAGWATAQSLSDMIGDRKVKVILFNLYDKKKKSK